MGLCIGTVKCSPNAFVNTAWLVALCRNLKPQARATARTFSGDQSAFGLAFIAANSRCVRATGATILHSVSSSTAFD